MNKTKLISAFPGTGKTYMTKTSSKVLLDSDSSTFDKSMFPDNYISHIKSNMGSADAIFISSHKEVRDALVSEGLYFYLVYPHKQLKNEYLDRYKNRGSNEYFVKLLDENWDAWITELQNQDGCNHVVLSSGEYISDIINEIL